MAITINHNRRKVRVWINESLPCAYQATQVLEHTFEAKSAGHSDVRQAAIELLHYLPGRPLYGLLGASFTPTAATQLVIQVAVSTSEDERSFADSFAARLDQAAIGLPREYADGVSEGIFETDGWRALGSGILYFGWAAHGAVGSSRAVFRRLSNDIIRLLTVEVAPDSEAEVATLLQATTQ